ncbi:MAG: phosphoribosylanthranilate isomerase [Coprococcus sp.]|nr:phosphoribosylanthranilate isomerase [Coprococcus sp.]
MTKIKICGLTRMEDIRAVNHLRPDFVGFVFAKSRRRITDGKARELRQALDMEIPAVGVFVDGPIEHIEQLCRENVIQMAQLHGDEDGAYIRRLRVKIPGIPIIKAVRVKTTEQIYDAEQMDCNYLLLDAFAKDTYGGSGRVFDWSLIPTLSKPYFLAGGLNADTVREAIAFCAPYAVDVSSAVETAGVKDEEKIKKLIERVRKYEQ